MNILLKIITNPIFIMLTLIIIMGIGMGIISHVPKPPEPIIEKEIVQHLIHDAKEGDMDFYMPQTEIEIEKDGLEEGLIALRKNMNFDLSVKCLQRLSGNCSGRESEWFKIKKLDFNDINYSISIIEVNPKETGLFMMSIEMKSNKKNLTKGFYLQVI